MMCKRIIALLTLFSLVAGCARHNAAFMAPKMDQKTFARDLAECDVTADKEIAQMREEDEKAGRDIAKTSGENAATAALALLLVGPAGFSHMSSNRGVDQVALERCMLNRGYESRIVDGDDLEGLTAAREKGKEMQFLENLYRRYYNTTNENSFGQ